MPAKSKAQQKAAGMALAAKEGKIKPSELKGAAKSMYKMSKEDLKKFAGTKHEGLPEKKKKEESVNEYEDPYRLEPYVLDIIDELTRKGYSEDLIDMILNDPKSMDMIYSGLEHNKSPQFIANRLNELYNDYINENTNMNMKRLVKESLNEESEVPKLVRFADVEEGDVAIDYNDEEGEVLDKIAYDDFNLDSVEEFLRMYDSTGAMQSGLEEGLTEPDEDGEIKMIAVYNPEDNASYVYTYGYDGAYVPVEFANEGSMNEDGDDAYHAKFLRDRKKLQKKYKNDPELERYLDEFDREHGY